MAPMFLEYLKHQRGSKNLYQPSIFYLRVHVSQI